MKNVLILGSIGAVIGVSIIFYGSFSFLQVYNQSLLRQTADTYKLDFPECFTDERLSSLRFRGRSSTGCTLNSFEPSSSVYHLWKTKAAVCPLADGRHEPHEDVSGPPKIKRLGSVSFILSSEVFPEAEYHRFHCAYLVTVNFPNGQSTQFEFAFNNEPRFAGIEDSEYPRYEAALTVVQRERPIVGLIHDRETHEMYYLVTKWIF